jgi:hypothetical protein
VVFSTADSGPGLGSPGHRQRRRGGIPFLPHDERRVDLELVETRTFDSGVVALRYRRRTSDTPPTM